MSEHGRLPGGGHPAVEALLRQRGRETLWEYLWQIRHSPLPDILPAEDLPAEVRSYLSPFFGGETAGRAAEVMGRCRCLSTGNHHHPAFEYMTVQDTILYDQWLRMHGEGGDVVPFLSASNVNLTSSLYPRGMIVYDCGLPEGRLRLPLYHWKRKRPCVAALEGISPRMIGKAIDRLGQEVRCGTISSSMADALEEFCRNILLSDQVQRFETLREQTTVINAMLSQRYFTDRKPQYLWIPLETLSARLLVRDLGAKGGLLDRMLFCREMREQLLRELEGVSGCWTGETGGTHFFWGLDRQAVLFPLRLREGPCGPVLAGENSLGEAVEIPFADASITEGLADRTLLPGLFLCFMEIHFLRDFTVLGGYYQPTYLRQMRSGLLRTLRRQGEFEKEAAVIAARADHMTLGLVYLLRDHGKGVFPVSTAELLEQPVSASEIEAKLQITLEASLR